MSKNILGLLLLASLSASLALAGDSRDINHINPGSIMTLKGSIEIPSHTWSIRIEDQSGTLYCDLFVTSASDYTRFLAVDPKGPATYEISHTAFNTVYLKDAEGSSLHAFICRDDHTPDESISISDFERLISKYFTIEVAPDIKIFH